MSLMLHTRSTLSVIDKRWLRVFTGCSKGILVYSVQEQVDLDTSVDAVKRKMIDAAGAGKSFTSPGWLTQLGRLWGGKSVRCNMCFVWRRSWQPQQGTTVAVMLQDTPVADAKPDDIKDLLGGALFKALFKWMQESGPVYLLPTGDLLKFVSGPLLHAA